MTQEATHGKQPSPVNAGSPVMVSWESPSNIALIKYWGKKPLQIPQNASLSFALSKAITRTRLTTYPNTTDRMRIEFSFDGKPNAAFAYRIEKYLQGISAQVPFLKNAQLKIESSNTFPHSSGIASSASAMSALALCLMDTSYQLSGKNRDNEFYTKASFLGRLGSGSAARSIYPGYVVWGQCEDVDGSTDEHAVQLETVIHPSFQNLKDAVLITHSGEKAVSSSVGHGLMENHPFAEARYMQAGKNIHELIEALGSGDEKTFIRIIENEAMTLHALMMSSQGGFSLLNEKTWAIINEIKRFRESSGIFMAFTLDAGPNVHLFYKPVDKKRVVQWIEQKLLVFCERKFWMDDAMGSGPEKMLIS